MSKLKDTYHYINCLVPVLHRFGDIKKGTVNKYYLAQKIANKHHRGSVGGGGCGMSSFYDVSVYMPPAKVKAFRDELKANNIRSRDYGPEIR